MMTQNAFAVFYCGVLFLGLLVGEIEVPGKPFYICFGDVDSIIAAAVGRALRAIEQHSKRPPIFFFAHVFKTPFSIVLQRAGH